MLTRIRSAVVCCLWLSLAGSLPALEKLEHVKLKTPAADFAIAPDSGLVAAVFAGSNEAVFYPKLASDGSIADAVTVKVGRQPVAIVHKAAGDKGYFIVACEDGNELTIIDAKTLKVQKSVPVEISKPNFLSASLNKNDPYVYYCGASHTPTGFVLGRVNLTQMKDLGPLAQSNAFSLTEAATSADGRLLYPRSRNSIPSGFAVISISESSDPAKPVFRELLRRHESSEFYVADPFGQFIVSGKQVYSTDLRKLIGTLKMSPLLVSANRPILAGVEGNLLSIVSRNSLGGLAAVRLPFAIQKPKDVWKPLGGKDHQQPRIMETADTLVVAHGADIAVIPFSAITMENEAFLVVDAPGESAFLVGQERVIKLVPKNSKAALKITKAPEGVALKDNALTWTPNASQVGPHLLILEVKVGEAKTSLTLDWVVRYPSVDLGMIANKLAVDEAGTAAAVLEQTSPFNRNNQQAETRVTLIDLKTLKIVGTTKVATGASEIAIDSHFVYVNSVNSDAFFALDRKDLSKSQRRFIDGGRVQKIVPITDRLLAVANMRLSVAMFRTPSLEQADSADIGLGIHALPNRRLDFASRHPEAIRDGWIHEGLYYDKDLKKMLAAIWPQGFWQKADESIIPTDSTGRYSPRGFDNGGTLDFGWLDKWGVHVQNDQLMRGLQTVGALRPKDHAGFGNDVAALLPDQPAAVWVGISQDGYLSDGGSRWRVQMSYCELLGGTSKETLKLLDEPLSFGRSLGTAGVLLATRPGRIVAVANDQLFSIETPKLDTTKFLTPIRASKLPAVQVLGAAQEVKIPLSGFIDAGAIVEVAMRKEERGIEIAKDKQSLILDGKTIAATFASRLVPHLASAEPDRFNGQKFKSSDERLDAYLKDAGSRFEKIVGRKPNGIPVWQPLEFTVKNKDLQSLDIAFGVFVEVPEGTIRDEAKKAFEKNRMKPAPNEGGSGAATANLLREQEELKKRVSELEKQLEQINRKLDVILDLPKEKGKR